MTDFKNFKKSSRSGGGNGSCVEVANQGARFGVRDSKDQNGPVLVFGQADWVSFTAAVKHGAIR